MRKMILPIVVVPFLIGCVSESPAITKSKFGNLEVNVYGPKDVPVHQADIYVDGLFIGNATSDKPVLYIKTGQREVRVQLEGCELYDRDVNVLGEPNHQVLNVLLKPHNTEEKPAKKP